MTNLAPSFDQPDTWYKMLQMMQQRQRDTNERLGEAAFNALVIAWPEVAEIFRGTDADPFYVEKPHDPRFLKFIDQCATYFC